MKDIKREYDMKTIIAKEAWAFLEKNSHAVLVDVRTEEEWHRVGFPDISSLGRAALALTWHVGEEDAFIEKLDAYIPDKKTPILFLCRSGARSHAASLLAASHGYGDIANIIDGFEDKHAPGTGWRAGGLPYVFLPLRES